MELEEHETFLALLASLGREMESGSVDGASVTID